MAGGECALRSLRRSWDRDRRVGVRRVVGFFGTAPVSRSQ